MKRRVVLIALAALLVVACVLAIGVGAVAVPPRSVIRVLLRLVGVGPEPTVMETAVVLHIRLPRILAAVVVGGGLAVSGAVMQGLFRNPMASPDILGISAGSSLGAVIAVTTGLVSTAAVFLPVFAALGALGGAGVISVISSHRGRTSLLFVVLAGLAVSSLFNGIVSAALLFSNTYEVSQFIFWTMGGLDGRTWRHLGLALPALVPALVVLFAHTRELNLFALGEDHAHSLGMRVERTKRLLLATTAVATSMAISVAGPIGFVGLLVPHLFRLILGPDHRYLLPASALGGALFLVLSDLVGRVLIAPLEIRVGIITALAGSPYFLYLILRSQRRGSVA